MQEIEDGNITVSVLQFTPSSEDDGTMLICHASNEKLREHALQDSKLLSVTCKYKYSNF